MTAPPRTDPAAFLDRLMTEAVPNQRGLAAWRSLLRAHASLMRALATDIVTKTGLTLGEFDVLAQLAFAGGKLGMTDLASRAFSSRSAMTRRIDHLVAEGLVERTESDADARATVATLTDAGLERLAEITPVHLAGIAKLFVGPLDDEELALLECVLDKVAVDCSFG